ncbi:MAG TPA: hypothetical protein VGD40_05180 [Chryseosolibacter sp.]
MKKQDTLKYKDFPEGSASKRLYDYHHLPFQSYLSKYYVAPDLKSWNSLVHEYVLPSFDNEQRNYCLLIMAKKGAPFRPDFEKLEEYWARLKSDRRFDEELGRFFSFLGACNFFERFNIDLNDWLHMKNWQKPARKKVLEDARTIMEILSFNFGVNFLKSELALMPWVTGRG